MPLTWLQLARDGALPVSERTIETINENARKVFGEQPTVSPDGELIVKGAVFKPRKKVPASDASPPARPASQPTARATAAHPAAGSFPRAAPRPAPQPAARPTPHPRAIARVPVAQPPRSSPAFTFPGAANVLNAAAQQGRSMEDDDDDDVAAGIASYYELMDELTSRYDCDDVRRKIQRFLSRKTMSQAAFLREMKVNHNSFTKFMSYSGPNKGRGNKAYHGALLYFHEHGPEVTEAPPAPATTTSAKESKISRREQHMKADIFFNKINSITLSEPVYVYDDCDDVRKKLNELIDSKIITQTALMKHLGVTTNTLRRFLTVSGKREGCAINVYKFAYIMFEKLRIAQGQPKSRKRLQTERERPQGYSLKRDPTHDDLAAGESLPSERMHA
jgi:hypothetical protein